MAKDFFSQFLGTPKIKTSTRGRLLRKRDIQRQINPFKRVREPISTKVKDAVRKRAKGKCEAKGCKHSKYLEFHHKNMKSDSNRVSNIILLCPIHHRELHDKHKRVVEKDSLGIREIKSRVVSKEKAKEIKKKKANNILGIDTTRLFR